MQPIFEGSHALNFVSGYSQLKTFDVVAQSLYQLNVSACPAPAEFAFKIMKVPLANWVPTKFYGPLDLSSGGVRRGNFPKYPLVHPEAHVFEALVADLQKKAVREATSSEAATANFMDHVESFTSDQVSSKN